MRSQAPSGLAVHGLVARYPGGEAPALDGVDLAVGPGEVLAVVGPSGSGKSTLLRVVAGLLAPAAGAVEIDGVDVTRTAPERRPVSMVFQGYALFPHLTVADNIGFGLAVRRVRKDERTAAVAEAAATLGLTDLLERLPGALSGGERQRVALARALVRDPVVFLLDVPLSSLDAVLRTDARRELAQVLRAQGRCGVHVTHDQVEARTVGDRVAVLRSGRVEQVGTPREVYDAPATAFVAGFVGSPPAAMLMASGGGAGPVRPPTPAADGDTLAVRPEHVHLDPAGTPLQVLAVEDLGHEVLVLLECAGQRLGARVPAARAPREGDLLPVHVEPHRVMVFGPDGARR